MTGACVYCGESAAGPLATHLECADKALRVGLQQYENGAPVDMVPIMLDALVAIRLRQEPTIDAASQVTFDEATHHARNAALVFSTQRDASIAELMALAGLMLQLEAFRRDYLSGVERNPDVATMASRPRSDREGGRS